MKTVLITGASSGIGKNIGEYLSSKKFKVYGTCRNPLNYPDTKFELVKANINNKKEIDECVDYILSKEYSIEILINNAGIGFTGPIEDSKINDVEKLFNTNFFGPIEMIKSVLPSMRKNKNGLIINMTSIAGYIGLPFRGIYCASKSALEILTESLRLNYLIIILRLQISLLEILKPTLFQEELILLKIKIRSILKSTTGHGKK